ncbi:GPI mannosyltransferase 4 [Hortaea werneckii]|nr:GPI mannosyltransferase 4 [Hortaea werneckii]
MRRGSLYLLLVLVRVYFAISTSYIHPDEHFQGPEIIAGEIFGWPVYKTWEFTSEQPIRSIFPLRLIYGPPLILLKWLAEGAGYKVSPLAVFYVLRVQMFLLSFVLEDWALHELLPIKPQRATALLLVASSYVTWTFQMHTFSNSLETIIVLWCLVLMGRMRDDREHTQVKLCMALAFLGVLGIFNRITFPVFLLVPGTRLLPDLVATPWRLLVVLLAGSLTALMAVATDTEYYTGSRLNFSTIFQDCILTPYNNMLYNLNSANLAQHGSHPFWQHFIANLPQLLGPAIPLLLFSSRRNTLFWSSITGIAILSCFSHQEARFLLPAVPLLLASIRLPDSPKLRQTWLGIWILFNILAATIFGLYHQAGVLPVQDWIRQHEANNFSHVFWWKTYSPPRWLLGQANAQISTTDLMGISGPQMMDRLGNSLSCEQGAAHEALLVAPGSATFLDAFTSGADSEASELSFELAFSHRRHVGLDDLDFGDDGFGPTIQRVFGRRGLNVWRVSKFCPASG